MSKNVQAIFADSNVSSAVRSMVGHDIGCLVVKDSQGILGMFTERDLLSKVLARHKKLEEPLVMEVMTSSFNVISREATMIEAAKMMSERRGRLIVFEDGDPKGLVTATDMIREIHRSGMTFDFKETYSGKTCQEAPETKLERIVQLMDRKRIGSVLVSSSEKLPRGIFTERDLLRIAFSNDFSLEEAVGEYATRPIISARMGIDGREAAAIMVNNHIKRLPLTRSETTVGIVTARDLVEAFADSTSVLPKNKD